MSIHDFHSQLSSRNETNALFRALRRLRRVEDIRILRFDEEAAGGWYPWNDASQPPLRAAAQA